jgi:adenosylcobinamide-phosphate synthase
MGAYLRRAGAGRARGSGPARELAGGSCAWLGGAAAAVAAARGVERLAAGLPRPARPLVLAGALWPLLALRLLLEEVRRTESALARDVSAGRAAVARIVSRPTDDLDASEVRGAALSSLAENLSDSVVAPLLWFSCGGLPAAALYRYVNTADAMWGTRGELEWWGKTAARADDVANLLPARLTAALLARGRVPLAALRREAARTPSPNAGWPMAALALRLGVRLEKPGVYRLNPGAPPPAPEHTARALREARTAGWAAAALLTLAERRRIR